MQPLEIKQLLKRYQEGTCTEDEKSLVESWYLQYKVENPKILSESEYESDINEILAKLDSGNKPPRIILWSYISIAALILVTMSVTWFLYFAKQNKDDLQGHKFNIAKDISPGGNKAVLTLADGSKVNLTDLGNGEIAKQAGLKIVKTANGHLHYIVNSTSDGSEKQEISYNTIETPNGGQYQITLPDGSNVWLDAASSLRYPTKFSKNERKVELTGQAYFEIAKSKDKPFRVISNKQQVEVLGTHFNINAYKDQPETITTLLEGSVKVGLLNDKTSNLLRPGQQAKLIADRFELAQVDVEEAIAWKNGYFVFPDEEVSSVLNKIARWYDVEVVCDNKLDGIKIGGTISRSKNLSEVLRVLQLTKKIKFKVEERRIIAMP